MYLLNYLGNIGTVIDINDSNQLLLSGDGDGFVYANGQSTPITVVPPPDWFPIRTPTKATIRGFGTAMNASGYVAASTYMNPSISILADYRGFLFLNGATTDIYSLLAAECPPGKNLVWCKAYDVNDGAPGNGLSVVGVSNLGPWQCIQKASAGGGMKWEANFLNVPAPSPDGPNYLSIRINNNGSIAIGADNAWYFQSPNGAPVQQPNFSTNAISPFIGALNDEDQVLLQDPDGQLWLVDFKAGGKRYGIGMASAYTWSQRRSLNNPGQVVFSNKNTPYLWKIGDDTPTKITAGGIGGNSIMSQTQALVINNKGVIAVSDDSLNTALLEPDMKPQK
jgi:hypothetical protein